MDRIFNKLKEEMPEKRFYYIDGEVSGKKREIIKNRWRLPMVR
jgi:hypothetical protein